MRDSELCLNRITVSVSHSIPFPLFTPGHPPRDSIGQNSGREKSEGCRGIYSAASEGKCPEYLLVMCVLSPMGCSIWASYSSFQFLPRRSKYTHHGDWQKRTPRKTLLAPTSGDPSRSRWKSPSRVLVTACLSPSSLEYPSTRFNSVTNYLYPCLSYRGLFSYVLMWLHSSLLLAV